LAVVEKMDAFMWACSQLRNAVDGDMYGSVVIKIQNGHIGEVRREEVLKPCIDRRKEKP
jgi:hypothetical protein